MKAEILVVTVIGLLAIMFLGLWLISAQTGTMPSDVTNSTAYNETAQTVSILFVGAGAIPIALLVVVMMIVFFGLLKLVG